MNIEDAKINTAGAFICIDGLYLFAIGIRPHNGHIPIVRLGGHLEKHETGWQCAIREVYEEAGLPIKLLSAPGTYLADATCEENELQLIRWRKKNGEEPAPFLVVSYPSAENISLSLMYLAYTKGIPKPSSEVKGLLLLKPEEIHRLCQRQMTLEEYLQKGGKALFSAEFDTKLALEPFIQLRLLSRILSLQSESEGTSDQCWQLGQ
jgi:hypothetical protein